MCCGATFVARLPEGPQYFPDDYLTDQPERFLAAEILREKILHLDAAGSSALGRRADRIVGRQPKRLVRIAATIYVERPDRRPS